MKLVEKVPKDLYKIFGSKYMEFYMQFLVALYEESSQSLFSSRAYGTRVSDDHE